MRCFNCTADIRPEVTVEPVLTGLSIISAWCPECTATITVYEVEESEAGRVLDAFRRACGGEG